MKGIVPPPEGKLEPLGTIILQSMPVTKEEGEVWLTMVAKVLPSEIFTHYSWVPIQNDSN
jgi:hypothetical protein